MPTTKKSPGASRQPASPRGDKKKHTNKTAAAGSRQGAGRQAPSKGGAAPAKKRRGRRGRYLLYYILAGMFAVSLGVILSLTVFFKIETILVKGSTVYQEAAIVDTAGIRVGENLFRIKEDLAAEELLSTYPYIEGVRLHRRLPVTLVIEVQEATPMGSFLQEDGGYVLVSEMGRVLALGSGAPPGDKLQVKGVQVQGVAPCEQLPDNLSESMTMFRYLYRAVEETGFTGITAVDLSDEYNIRMYYEDRLRIELGSEGDLEDKLDFVQYAIEHSIEPGFEGLVDVTIPGQLRIRKMEIHEPGTHGEETPSPEAEETRSEPDTEEGAAGGGQGAGQAS